jgi:hypothetical protein
MHMRRLPVFAHALPLIFGPTPPHAKEFLHVWYACRTVSVDSLSMMVSRIMGTVPLMHMMRSPDIPADWCIQDALEQMHETYDMSSRDDVSTWKVALVHLLLSVHMHNGGVDSLPGAWITYSSRASEETLIALSHEYHQHRRQPRSPHVSQHTEPTFYANESTQHHEFAIFES